MNYSNFSLNLELNILVNKKIKILSPPLKILPIFSNLRNTNE